MDARADVIDFIGEVDDPELHDILELRFIKGQTYSEIAASMHYSDESVPRKRVNRFFSKSK
jgi:DNA-directed RNA polymerase specialized sigma24 family protein